MSEKIRSDAKLKTLPEARQAEIAEHARDHSVRETVAWLKADGLTTSIGALSEFLSWFCMRQRFSAFEANSQTLIELLRKKRPEMPESELEAWGAEYFQVQAVQNDDPETFLAYAKAKTKGRQKERELEIKKQMLELAQKKFQRETCELFIKWSEDQRAREVVSSGGSHAEKMEQLGRLVFGEEWDK